MLRTSSRDGWAYLAHFCATRSAEAQSAAAADALHPRRRSSMRILCDWRPALFDRRAWRRSHGWCAGALRGRSGRGLEDSCSPNCRDRRIRTIGICSGQRQALPVPDRNDRADPDNSIRARTGADRRLRKLIAFDDDTFDKLTQLARDRMATFQELADEAFADLLRKHGIPIDLKDALRKSAASRRRRSSDTPRKTRSKGRQDHDADPDPFEQGQRAARKNIPAEGQSVSGRQRATCALGRRP